MVRLLRKPYRVGYLWVFHVEGRTDNYVVEHDPNSGYWHCTCPSFKYRKRCYHCDWVESRFFSDYRGFGGMKLVKGIDIYEGKAYRTADCGFDLLDDVYPGGFFSSDSINGVFGDSTSGKSLFALETAVYRIGQGDNVLYIDTEKGASMLWKVWAPVFAKKYGVSEEDLNSKFFLLKDVTLEDFAHLLNYDLEIFLKKSKIEVTMSNWLETKCSRYLGSKNKLKECKEKHGIVLMEDIIEEMKIKHIVVDSFSQLIESIPSSVQNFSPRADISKKFFISLGGLQSSYDLTILMVHKASKSPMALDTRENIFGGSAVKYYTKRILYIDYPTKKHLERYRRFWVIRGENSPRWSDVAVYYLGSNGFEEPNQMELAEMVSDIFTGAEERYGARLLNLNREITAEELGIEGD